jgi:hypothetical protein
MRMNALGLVALSVVVLGCGGRARTDGEGSESAGGTGGNAGGLGAGGNAGGAGGKSGAGGAGGATDPLWGCLDQPRPPSGPGPFDVRLHVVDMASSIPVAGADVALCRKIDPECAVPEARFLTDANGDAAFEVGAQEGSLFVRITQTDPAMSPEQRMMPVYYFFPTITGDVSVNVVALTSRIFQTFNILMNVQPLPDRGMIFVNTLSLPGHRSSRCRHSVGLAGRARHTVLRGGRRTHWWPE